MKVHEIFETESATGEYHIQGDHVIADNSGYEQVFSKREIQQGLQQGGFTDQHGDQWKVEVNPKMYGLSGSGHFVVSNGDVMYEFRLDDFR